MWEARVASVIPAATLLETRRSIPVADLGTVVNSTIERRLLAASP
jgi:hypothetical protein